MVRVGDLVEPGPEEVGLTCLPPLVGSHESPRRDPDGSMESRLPGRSNCQKSPPSRPETGKHEYVPRPKAHARSDIWQFFTDDVLGHSGQKKKPRRVDHGGAGLTFQRWINTQEAGACAS